RALELWGGHRRNGRNQSCAKWSAKAQDTKGRNTMKEGLRNALSLTGSSLAIIAGLGLGMTGARADAVSDAKAAVAKYAGPQTTWEGPTSAPKPDKGKKVVFLSGDEQNDISHLYGVYIKQAGEKLGWDVTIIDGKGSPTSWLARPQEEGTHHHER